MITYKEDALIITIEDYAPQERRDWIMKALAATIRWNAHANGDKTNADDANLVVLAQLLEEIIDVEPNAIVE
jgi:hypothetical protein